MSDAAQVIYRNTRFRRVRALQYGLWLAALAFLLLGFLLPATSPGENAAEALRILAPILAVMALGMEFYGSLYVTTIEAGPKGISVETLAWCILTPIGKGVNISHRDRRRTLLAWDTLPALSEERSYHAHRQHSFAVMLRRPGARLPLIIDTTRDAVDEQALATLRRRYTTAGQG